MSEQAPGTAIAGFLAAVRALLRRRQARAGAARWVAVTLGAAVLLLLGAGGLGPSTLWRPLAGLAAVALAAGGALGLLRARRAFASDDDVARFVGKKLPSLGGDLLSAVELGRELPKLAQDPVLSAALVDALRARVAERVARLEPAGLVDQRDARRRAARQLGAAGLAWILALTFFSGALKRGLAELRASRGEHVATSAEPIIGDLRVELRYPAYTGLEPRIIPGSSGQILALPGTEVALSARALLPAREAQLVVDEDDRPDAALLPVKIEAGPRLDARFTARKPGAWRFVLTTADRTVREPDAHRVDLEPDHPPRVDLYAPAESLEVAGPRRVELGYSVDDDYGLGEIQLAWRIGSAPEQRRTVVPAPAKRERSAAGKFEWDLADLDLSPGVRVAYHLEAKDNDNVDGPNVGLSRTFYLTMFSPREKQQAAVADQEQLLELAIAQLADRLEVGRGDDGELADPMARIHNQAEALLVAFTRAEQSLTEAGGERGETRAQLREMHARLGKLSHEEELLLAELRHKRPPPGRRALETQNGRQVPELERDVIALDDLLGKQRLEELLAVGDEISQTRDRLKQLMEQYKKTRSDGARRELERELRELERKLAELSQKAQKLASELPDQFLNREAMGKNDIQDQLDKVRELLAKGDVEQAMAELERMSQSIDKLTQSMEGDLRGFRRERFSAEEKAMAELESKLSDLAHDEKQLKAETAEVQQRARAEAQRLMRDKIDPLAKRAREKVAQLKKQVEQIDRSALAPYSLEDLDRVKQRTDDLDKMLQGGDLDEARHAAREADQGLQGLGADLRDEEMRAWHGLPPATQKVKKGARDHVDQGQQLAHQLADELNRAMPQPNELMSPDDQRRMGDLAERQKAARKRAQELERELGKKLGPDGKPMQMPPQLEKGLKDAGEHMDRAEGELRRRDPRDAEGEESQALDKLAKMQEQLQRERRPRDQSGGGKEPVKIPGADEYKAPKEFRQDILDAMKRAAPQEYKEQVRRYYEELVK